MSARDILPLEVQLLALGVLAAFLARVVRLVRAQRLNLRDSLLWLVSTLVAVVITLFPQLLASAAEALSIQVPANALFGVSLLYLAVNVLSNTIASSVNAGQVRRLAQECALLRGEIDLLSREAREPRDGGESTRA
jgi:hypothetical protein